MLRDVTLGQYFPGNSLLHKLDPRTKILLTLFYIAITFTAKTVLAFCVMTVIAFCMILISRISFVTILKSMKPLIFIMVFTATINIFFTTGEDIVFQFWKITIYREGLFLPSR